jgi:hypothetical protein
MQLINLYAGTNTLADLIVRNPVQLLYIDWSDLFSRLPLQSKISKKKQIYAKNFTWKNMKF